MKRYVMSAVAIAASALVATSASAATFAGGSQGCFVAAPAVSCALSSLSTDGGLTYNGGTATFNQNTDASGFAGIGGPTNNFGYITLVSNARNYSSDLFNLMITFTLPTGANSNTFTANLLGSLTAFGNGGVQITFANANQTINTAAGSFFLHVNDVSFSGGSANDTILRQDISGYIRAVPEPATWAMMLLGFGGIGMAMRRRRQPALAQVA